MNMAVEILVVAAVAVAAAASAVAFCVWRLKREFSRLGDVLESMQIDVLAGSLRQNTAEGDDA